MKRFVFILIIALIVIVCFYAVIYVLEDLEIIDTGIYNGIGGYDLQNSGVNKNDNITSKKTPENIVASAQKIANYMKSKEMYYSQNLNELGKTYNSGLMGSCCATYVSWVLQDLKIILDDQHVDSVEELNNYLMNDNRFKKIEIENPTLADLEPGDIQIFKNGNEQFAHTNIYAGNSRFWDAGENGNGAFIGITKTYSIKGNGNYLYSYRLKSSGT